MPKPKIPNPRADRAVVEALDLTPLTYDELRDATGLIGRELDDALDRLVPARRVVCVANDYDEFFFVGTVKDPDRWLDYLENVGPDPRP